MEIKQLGGPFPIEVVDADQGIAKEVIAVYGNVDYGLDRLHPGSFAKTIAERVEQVMVVDSHDHSTVKAVLGVCLGLEEIGVEGLPEATRDQYPEATGGVIATTRYLLDTSEGAGAFARRKAGALPGSSFGYDAIVTDRTNERVDGKPAVVRELREIKLYEYGPCVMGMNAATSVVGVKSAVIEGKPWSIFTRDGEYCVHRVDSEGTAEGDPLGCHPTLEDAEAQVVALYANVEEGNALSDAGLIVPVEDSPWWASADLDAVVAGVQAWAGKALGGSDEVVAELGDYLREWVIEHKEEGAAASETGDEAGSETGTTSPATGGPEPGTETPPTFKTELALLGARIRVAHARLDLSTLDHADS